MAKSSAILEIRILLHYKYREGNIRNQDPIAIQIQGREYKKSGSYCITNTGKGILEIRTLLQYKYGEGNIRNQDPIALQIQGREY